MPGAFEPQVLVNMASAFLMNQWIWFLRAILRKAPPSLLPPGQGVEDVPADKSISVDIVGPGGVDQLRARVDSWACCGYNLFKEFGGQRIAAAPGDLSALRPDLVVVRNQAFSINYADVCVRWGLYESALRFVGWPIVPGFDIAGLVEVAGKESGYKVGERVCGFSLFGAYSSRVVVPQRQLMRIPANLSFDKAAALPAVTATALHAASLAGLWPAKYLGSCKHVLVHSAAGGVGDMLCQILKLLGMHVVGVVGAASKVSSCSATTSIDKSSADWYAEAQRIAPDGYCAIFDANGVSTMKKSYDLLCKNGRLVVYGFHSNLPKNDGGLGMLSPKTWLLMGLDMLRMPRFDPMDLTLSSKAVLGFNLSFFAEEHELCSKYLEQIHEWVESGAIVAPQVRPFSFEQVRDSHTALTSGRTVGKMVIALPPCKV